MCNCAESAEQPLKPLPHAMVVNIQSGDVLVVRANKVIPGDRIKSQLDAIVPGANVLVIDDGAELTHILRPSA